jgi:hypothetical protein
MLMAGKLVTRANDPLHPVDVVRVHRGIIDPAGLVADKVRQLRALRSVDPEAYRRAKTTLPYLVNALFSPAVRNRANFAYAEHFILDMDKIGLIGRHPEEMKSVLAKDERILLMFTSPGNDGLKLLFKLNERITDAGYYSTFYRIFAADFSRQHSLGGRIDTVTHDVSRCCFMSFDPAAHFRPDAIPVDPSVFTNDSGMPAWTAAERAEAELAEAGKTEQAEAGMRSPDAMPLQGDIMQRIREKLLPSLQRKRPEKEFFQPAELLDALPGLSDALSAMDIRLEGERPIQYGRQLKLVAGKYWAEVNLFYGKGGFRAIPTTKTGSHPELAELGRAAVQSYFDTWGDENQNIWPGQRRSI